MVTCVTSNCKMLFSNFFMEPVTRIVHLSPHACWRSAPAPCSLDQRANSSENDGFYRDGGTFYRKSVKPRGSAQDPPHTCSCVCFLFRELIGVPGLRDLWSWNSACSPPSKRFWWSIDLLIPCNVIKRPESVNWWCKRSSKQSLCCCPRTILLQSLNDNTR